MRTNEIAPTVTSKLESDPPILAYRQVEELGITIEQYHLTPNDAEFSPLPMHVLTWNIGEPGDLIKIEGERTQRALMMQGVIAFAPHEPVIAFTAP